MSSTDLVKSQTDNIALDEEGQKEFDKKINKLEAPDETGTMYIGHLPHGFYENEIQEYFSQFGVVTKVRLARSKKTGGHKGYGYVQFQSEDVAKIAAESMNNYMMFEKLLKCEFVPKERIHPEIWKGANKRFVWLNRQKRSRELHNKAKTATSFKKTTKRLKALDNKRRAKLLELGIDFQFPGYKLKATKKKNKERKTPAKKQLKEGKGLAKIKKAKVVSKKSKKE